MEESEITTDSVPSANPVTTPAPLRSATTIFLTGAYVMIIAVGIMSVFLSGVNYVLGIACLLFSLGLTYILHRITKQRFPASPAAPSWPLDPAMTLITPPSDATPAPPWPQGL